MPIRTGLPLCHEYICRGVSCQEHRGIMFLLAILNGSTSPEWWLSKSGQVAQSEPEYSAKEWESYDEMLRDRKDLRPQWYIVRRDETTLLTSLGSVTYHKTLFKNKFTGDHEYLLDPIMGIEKHARMLEMTEDAEAKLLEEAVQTSYRRGGESACISDDEVSKETTMNKIHAPRFPQTKPLTVKRVLKYLYIDADEDHVSLQFLEKKGDIKKTRSNTVMPKLIYVYEGIIHENGRNELMNKKYFGGVYEGSKSVEQLWEEVSEYIEESYDTEALEKIYINGDGAAWIRSGQRILDKARFCLTSFICINIS